MKHLHYLLLAVGMMFIACNDTVEVGSGLLNDESLEVKVDTLYPAVQIVQPDSTQTFVKNANDIFGNGTYMVGKTSDPDFGTTEAICYFTASLVSPFPNEMRDNIIDSVVVIIPYDTLGRYGPDKVEQDMRLYLIDEPFVLENEDELYAFDGYDFGNELLIDKTIYVDHTDTLVINDHIQDTAGLKVRPQLRLAMDPDYWMEFFKANQDSITAESFDLMIPGFALTASSATNSMVGLQMEFPSVANLTFYYTDSIRKNLALPLGKFRQNQYIHDYSGSAIEAQMSSGNSEVMYIQSQDGVDMEIDMSSVKTLDEFILNSATLELTVIEDDNPEVHPAPSALFAKYENDEGEEVTIVDILANPGRYDGLLREVEGQNIRTYTMDISEHVGAYLSGDFTSSKIVLFANGKAHRPNRVKVGGPDHPDHPATLKIIGTLP